MLMSRNLHGLVYLSVVTAWFMGKREEKSYCSLARIYVQSAVAYTRDIDPALWEPNGLLGGDGHQSSNCSNV